MAVTYVFAPACGRGIFALDGDDFVPPGPSAELHSASRGRKPFFDDPSPTPAHHAAEAARLIGGAVSGEPGRRRNPPPSACWLWPKPFGRTLARILCSARPTPTRWPRRHKSPRKACKTGIKACGLRGSRAPLLKSSLVSTAPSSDGCSGGTSSLDRAKTEALWPVACQAASGRCRKASRTKRRFRPVRVFSNNHGEMRSCCPLVRPSSNPPRGGCKRCLRTGRIRESSSNHRKPDGRSAQSNHR